MAISLMQKLRLLLRGWSRRRDEEAQRKQDAFLRSNASWAPIATTDEARTGTGTQDKVAAVGSSVVPGRQFDLEGLQVAYLDDSGQIAYYLDTETGEVIEMQDAAGPEAPRYRRVPTRRDSGEIDERRAFIATLEASAVRQQLMQSVGTARFRSVLASDRTVERAWYNFRNARATEAIEKWLREVVSSQA